MRGGLSTPETLHKSALAHFDDYAVFAISVRCAERMTAEELARVEPPIQHAKFRETTVGALRAAGYDVVHDAPPPTHALIMLPRLPADEDYLRISATLGDPTVIGKERNDS